MLKPDTKQSPASEHEANQRAAVTPAGMDPAERLIEALHHAAEAVEDSSATILPWPSFLRKERIPQSTGDQLRRDKHSPKPRLFRIGRRNYITIENGRLWLAELAAQK